MGLLDDALGFPQAMIGKGVNAAWQSLPPEVRASWASGARAVPTLLGELSPGAGIRDAVNESARMTDAARSGDYWNTAGAGAGTLAGLLSAVPIVGATGRGAKAIANEFKGWFGASKVVDEAGKPLIVYRGEHGTIKGTSARTDPTVPTTGAAPSLEEIGYGDFQSQLPSLSFGSRKAANTYAMDPNDSRVLAQAPRVTPVHLKIENPIVHNTTGDPFVDFSELEQKLGHATAKKFAIEHANHVENTGNWREDINGRGQYLGVKDFLDKHPDRLGELYMDAYPLLDDPAFVKAARAKGFDGAIHGGNGENALETEYRIFHPSQAKPAIGTRIKSGLLKGEEND